jgi:hypothetical protein
MSSCNSYERRTGSICTLLACLLSPMGCGDHAAGSGSLRVSISGEQAALSGYPAGSGDDQIAFVDGWTLEFSKVLVSLSDFELRSADGDDADVPAEPVVADLHLGQPELWDFADVPAQRWDRVGFRYAPPTNKTRTANEVDAADVERMADEGYSLYIEGTAEKSGEKLEFAWGFPFSIEHTGCVSEDGTDGVVVADNARNEAQVTVHLDHLFFDDFSSDGAELRFDAMAAVAPDSGPLTLENLAEQSNLSDMKARDGTPLDVGYDPGPSFSPRPETLEDFVIAAATTTGHWNGEGHCRYERE